MFFLTKKQVAARAHVTPRTIENWVKRGVCPEPFKLGKACLWDRDQVITWLATQSNTTGGGCK